MYHKESPTTIQSMFNSIAERYDLTNSILSLSMHKYWNRTLVRLTSPKITSATLIDLCSGTGDIGFEYLKKAKETCHAYLVDFSSEMLEHAKQKANQTGFSSLHQLEYIQADVQHLPLPDLAGDYATMAYGIRNVQNPSLCFKEVFRVLKPGGRFGILELTRPSSPLLRFGHRCYLNVFMPLIGKCLTNNEEAYRYLCQSIQTFTAPQELKILLEKSGFQEIEIHPLTGGIATIIIGKKP